MSESPSVFWSVFSRAGGRTASRAVCSAVTAINVRIHPPSTCSARGIMLLRECRYGDVPHLSREPWTLPCGLTLTRHLPVLELDLCSAAVERVVRNDRELFRIAREEFCSLAEFLRHSEAKAVVTRTTMHHQLGLFKFATRPMPQGAHHRMDTFFRNMYILAYAHDGAERVCKRKPTPLAESAISARRFLERFG